MNIELGMDMLIKLERDIMHIEKLVALQLFCFCLCFCFLGFFWPYHTSYWLYCSISTEEKICSLRISLFLPTSVLNAKNE